MHGFDSPFGVPRDHFGRVIIEDPAPFDPALTELLLPDLKLISLDDAATLKEMVYGS
jgi:hypothetical protein